MSPVRVFRIPSRRFSICRCRGPATAVYSGPDTRPASGAPHRRCRPSITLPRKVIPQGASGPVRIELRPGQRSIVYRALQMPAPRSMGIGRGPCRAVGSGARLVEPFGALRRPMSMWRLFLPLSVAACLVGGCGQQGAVECSGSHRAGTPASPIRKCIGRTRKRPPERWRLTMHRWSREAHQGAVSRGHSIPVLGSEVAVQRRVRRTEQAAAPGGRRVQSQRPRRPEPRL